MRVLNTILFRYILRPSLFWILIFLLHQPFKIELFLYFQVPQYVKLNYHWQSLTFTTFTPAHSQSYEAIYSLIALFLPRFLNLYYQFCFHTILIRLKETQKSLPCTFYDFLLCSLIKFQNRISLQVEEQFTACKIKREALGSYIWTSW